MMGTNKFLYENMFRFADSFRVFVSQCWVLVLGIGSYIFSFKEGIHNFNDQFGTNCYKKGETIEEFGQKGKGYEVADGERVNQIGGETENSVMASSTSKYELSSGKVISWFIEEPKSMIFSVRELYVGSNDSTNCDNRIPATEGEDVIDQRKAEDSVDKVLKKQEDSVDNDFNKRVGKSFLDTGAVFYHEKTEDLLDKSLKKEEKETSFFDTDKVFEQEKAEDSVFVDKVLEKREEEMFAVAENEMRVFTEFRFLPKYDLSNEVPHLVGDCLSRVDSESDTIGSSDVFSRCSDDDIGLDSYEFLAERNFSDGLGTESLEALSEEEVESTETILDQETYVMREVTFDSDDDYIELKPESYSSSSVQEKHEDEDLFREEAELADTDGLSEESQLENSAVLKEGIFSSEDLNEAEDRHDDEEDLVYEAAHLGHTSEYFEESSFEEKEFISVSDSDDEDEDEFASEDDDLIEKLKMELKYARTGGLPTIMEESESPPKTVEELKPLRIDQKFEHKDHMKEIHKFYRSYLDKMRKLDILNSQTMHAIGLFQLKETGQSIKTQKSSVPAIKSLLAQNLWPCKSRSRGANTAFKFIDNLHKDFELVYVGQLCLSWEILHWQYKKALELQEFDSQELRQYNQVAGEFQIFQVLLQRFIENEPFQGCTRVLNHVNSRCAHCNFLQVPVIKDDSFNNKKGRKGDEEDGITIPTLTEIIEESLRVYWEFLCTDKDENNMILKGPGLQDSVDSELLSEIRTDFRKKEKRLKEILRSGSCIVKKLQKHHGNRFNRGLFFAQIELKLISRVLSMTKLTTDQLVWCHEKLAKINFCNRKLVVEPSFLLFPFDTARA